MCNVHSLKTFDALLYLFPVIFVQLIFVFRSMDLHLCVRFFCQFVYIIHFLFSNKQSDYKELNPSGRRTFKGCVRLCVMRQITSKTPNRKWPKRVNAVSACSSCILYDMAHTLQTNNLLLVHTIRYYLAKMSRILDNASCTKLDCK